MSELEIVPSIVKVEIRCLVGSALDRPARTPTIVVNDCGVHAECGNQPDAGRRGGIGREPSARSLAPARVKLQRGSGLGRIRVEL